MSIPRKGKSTTEWLSMLATKAAGIITLLIAAQSKDPALQQTCVVCATVLIGGANAAYSIARGLAKHGQFARKE